MENSKNSLEKNKEGHFRNRNDSKENAQGEFLIDQIRNHLEKRNATNNPFEPGLPSQQDIPEFFALFLGCGNGYTLDKMCTAFPNLMVNGIEPDPSLRAIAESRFAKGPTKILTPEFFFTEHLQIPRVDILICSKILVKLLDPQSQILFLNNLMKCVKPEGIYLFVEPLDRIHSQF